MDASPSDVANNNNIISNKCKDKAVTIASIKEESDEVYFCQYCEKEFVCQQAMAGHCNTHRSECTPKRKRTICKIQRDHKHLKNDPKVSLRHNSIIARLPNSFSRSTSTHCYGATSTSHEPLLRAVDYPPTNPLNVLKGPFEGPSAMAPPGLPPRDSLAKSLLNVMEGPSARAPHSSNIFKIPPLDESLTSLLNAITEQARKNHLAQSTNTFDGRSKPARAILSPYPPNILIRPSIGTPQRTFIGPKYTLDSSFVRDLNHPYNNLERLHNLVQVNKLASVGSCSRCVCGGNFRACEFSFFPLTPSNKTHDLGVDDHSAKDVDELDLKL